MFCVCNVVSSYSIFLQCIGYMYLFFGIISVILQVSFTNYSWKIFRVVLQVALVDLPMVPFWDRQLHHLQHRNRYMMLIFCLHCLPGSSKTISNFIPNFFQSFNQSKPQVPPVSQQMAPFQKPMQSPQHLPPSLQSHPQTPASYSQMQTPLASLQQLGQPQLPHSAGQTPFSQGLPSQHLLGLGGQYSVSQPQVQQTASSATALQTPLDVNLQPHSVSTVTNQQQLPAPVPQQLQHLQQPPSQLAQMLSQQTQTLQASFQSSQQAFSQLQQQLQLMQPSNQQQSSQPNKQQVFRIRASDWLGMLEAYRNCWKTTFVLS